MRHTFSPSSILLGSFTYQDAEDISRDEEFHFKFKGTERAFGGEIQHLFRSRPFNLTSGIGYFDLDGEIEATFESFEPDTPASIQTIPTDLRHFNVYAYGYINLLKHVTFTVGASFDSTSGDQPGAGDDQFNPKFGITWEPIPGTTLRVAVFRALKRTLITNQTLEPTQVAGFNQFFDDANMTESWRYGGAIDQKFTKNLFGGVEFSKRDLKVPFLDFTDPENPSVAKADWDEHLGRAYLFWTPHPWFALRAEYVFERFERVEELPEGLTELDTHRVPLGITFFHPIGLSASLTTTYWNQDGTFQSLLTGEIRSGRDDFWLVDAAINYRLPKRYGFISVGVRNLFDQRFKFFDDSDNPIIQPDRMFLARVTLALP
jgi:outer membrane receptor protein involved in Fe transport